MKTSSAFLILTTVGGGLLSSLAAAADTAPPPANPALTSEKTPGAPAESKATEKAKQEHVRAADPFVMKTPPPEPRPETKTPPPAATGYVWVPGHWTPVKGEWQWTAGEWGVPATPSSLWIPSRYDATTKKWSAGYWQPDRVQPIDPPPAEKGAPVAPGAPAPAPAPY